MKARWCVLNRRRVTNNLCLVCNCLHLIWSPFGTLTDVALARHTDDLHARFRLRSGSSRLISHEAPDHARSMEFPKFLDIFQKKLTLIKLKHLPHDLALSLCHPCFSLFSRIFHIHFPHRWMISQREQVKTTGSNDSRSRVLSFSISTGRQINAGPRVFATE